MHKRGNFVRYLRTFYFAWAIVSFCFIPSGFASSVTLHQEKGYLAGDSETLVRAIQDVLENKNLARILENFDVDGLTRHSLRFPVRTSSGPATQFEYQPHHIKGHVFQRRMAICPAGYHPSGYQLVVNMGESGILIRHLLGEVRLNVCFDWPNPTDPLRKVGFVLNIATDVNEAIAAQIRSQVKLDGISASWIRAFTQTVSRRQDEMSEAGSR